MSRTLSTATAIAVIVWAMISLSPQAVANEATELSIRSSERQRYCG